jgi:hypothetical protein
VAHGDHGEARSDRKRAGQQQSFGPQPVGERSAEEREHDSHQALQRQEQPCADDCGCRRHELGEQHRDGRPQHAVGAKRHDKEQYV